MSMPNEYGSRREHSVTRTHVRSLFGNRRSCLLHPFEEQDTCMPLSSRDHVLHMHGKRP